MKCSLLADWIRLPGVALPFRVTSGAWTAALLVMLSGLAPANQTPSGVKVQEAAGVAKIEISSALILAQSRKTALAKKYTAALDELEKSLVKKGNLDIIIHIREEKEALAKDGSNTPHKDAPLVKLREIYTKEISAIDGDVKTVRSNAVANFKRFVQDQEKQMTIAGDVDGALALRQKGKELAAELEDGTENGLDGGTSWLENGD